MPQTKPSEINTRISLKELVTGTPIGFIVS